MEIKLDYFSLKDIAESGQCFRFKKIDDNSYSVVIRGKNYILSQKENVLNINCSESEWEDFLSSYFDCDTDYSEIEKLVMNSGDEHAIEAYKLGSGIRILRQDLWEIIVSFLISQNNNIPRIKGSIEALCRVSGRKAWGGEEYSFPKASDISPLLFEKANLGLGYRVPYLKEIYEWVEENPFWLDYLKEMPYEEARKELLKRKGIGPKVADCICLFGLHHVEAFPIDTHVKQLIKKYYPKGFDFKYYGKYAGIIQQYLFYYEIKESTS